MTLKSIGSLCVLLRKPSSVPRKLWHAFIGHSLGRLLCLAPEEFEKSGSGPWPKKVVHHCIKGNIIFINSSECSQNVFASGDILTGDIFLSGHDPIYVSNKRF